MEGTACSMNQGIEGTVCRTYHGVGWIQPKLSGYGEAVCPENQAVDGTVYYKDKNGITNNSEYFSCSDFKSLFLNMQSAIKTLRNLSIGEPGGMTGYLMFNISGVCYLLGLWVEETNILKRIPQIFWYVINNHSYARL